MATYSKIMNHESSLEYPSDVEVSRQAKDIIRQFLSDSNSRLGRSGIKEIQAHPFFAKAEWTWDNIRNCTLFFSLPWDGGMRTGGLSDAAGGAGAVAGRRHAELRDAGGGE